MTERIVTIAAYVWLIGAVVYAAVVDSAPLI